jgi:hypothetical protein
MERPQWLAPGPDCERASSNEVCVGDVPSVATCAFQGDFSPAPAPLATLTN